MEKIWLRHGELSVEIWSLGACVNDVLMPDRLGQIGSVVLGYATEEERRKGTAYLGEICGPFANRIAAGGFALDGNVYFPEINESDTATLHGGPHGWSYADWEVVEAEEDQVLLRLDWEDPKDGGFPGPYHAEVEYRLDAWALTHTVKVTTETPSVVNVVAHPYFNLSGGSEKIDAHELQILASDYLGVDDALIPLDSAPWSVQGSAFDFRCGVVIGDALRSRDPQIRDHEGIDHAFILDGSGTRLAAKLSHSPSGRVLEIFTDYPALQVYTGQYLDESNIHPVGAGGPRSGIALETEEYPNAPRRADFPSAVLRDGATYSRTTTWVFQVI